MSSNVKPSSSAPVLRPLNDEVSSDSPVFTLTRSSRSHVTMSTSPSGYENATCGVDLYEPSSYNSESSNGWYATKSSAAPLYVDRQPAPVDVEANLSDSKFDDVPPSQHDVDLTTVFVPHMVLSCLALWCCGCFLGCFGFLFAGDDHYGLIVLLVVSILVYGKLWVK
jgi:hypothetical protein